MSEAPYAEAAWLYWRAGWRGVLPLPVRDKWPPPRGYTGWAGVEPSGADLQAWIEGPEGAGNIALRLPMGVYGLDVDAWGQKTGAQALRKLEERVGEPLPPTWIVTSRTDGVSGIRLYRAELPAGHHWRDEPAGHARGIEALHFGHRYAVVWPSIHPEGLKYVWWRPDPLVGAALAGDGVVPRVDELPWLPLAWVEALSEPGEARLGESATHAATLAAVHAWRDGDEWCEIVREAHATGMQELQLARDGAALHPAARARVWELVSLGHEGHVGARRALAEHYGEFVGVRSSLAGGRGGDRAKAEAEWWRLVRGAVGKLTGAPRETCDCAAWSGAGVQFDYPFQGEVTGVVSSADSGTTAADPAEAMLAELKSGEQIAEQSPPVALVRGLLYLDTLAWLIGRPGSFKSFVALDIAQHVAAGRDWAGRRVRAGRVLYLIAEGSGGMTLRMRAWRHRNGPLPTDAHFLTRPVQANSPEWNVLVTAAHRLGPSLIVVDTQARITVGIRENDNTEMGQFIAQLDRLRRATGACVLIVHHIGRNGEDARGASAIDGAQDTELKVERTGGPKSLTARLTTDKQKDGPDTESTDFEMVPVELGEDPETGEPITSLVVNTAVVVDPATRPWREGLAENQALILDILHEHFSARGGTRAEVMSVMRERARRGDGKWVKSSFYAAWNALLEKGLIGKVPGGERFAPVDPAEARDIEEGRSN